MENNIEQLELLRKKLISPQVVTFETDKSDLPDYWSNPNKIGAGTANAGMPSGGGGGSSTIIGLSDTPSSFGTAGQALVVNSNADGLVFDDISGGGGSYADSDVDAHINVSGASENDILSWNGTDYSWISQSGGGTYNWTIIDGGGI